MRGECNTGPSQLLCSSPGKSGQGKQGTPGILPGTGTACGQQISHISWDRCNREWMNPPLQLCPCDFVWFQASADAALLFKDEYAPSACLPCLPSSSVQTCVAGTRFCSAEAAIPTVKSEISSCKAGSLPCVCTEVCIHTFQGKPALSGTQALCPSVPLHSSLNLPRDLDKSPAPDSLQNEITHRIHGRNMLWHKKTGPFTDTWMGHVTPAATAQFCNKCLCLQNILSTSFCFRFNKGTGEFGLFLIVSTSPLLNFQRKSCQVWKKVFVSWHFCQHLNSYWSIYNQHFHGKRG